jgi:hypothetical protein
VHRYIGHQILDTLALAQFKISLEFEFEISRNDLEISEIGRDFKIS